MQNAIVIKIGGSSLRSAQLTQTLNLILKRKRSIIIVPGGGPFADLIRNAQNKYRFSDQTAHDMALLAMHQFGYLIREFSKDFVPCEVLEEFDDVLKKDKVPLWLPNQMAGLAKDVPKDWSMTSDGLSAWLTLQLGSEEVCLLKSCSIPENHTLSNLCENGIVDTQFLSLVKKHSLKWSVVEIFNEREIVKRIINPPRDLKH